MLTRRAKVSLSLHATYSNNPIENFPRYINLSI